MDYNHSAKSLRWLANQFQKIEDPKDDADKMVNCIHLYCENGANAITDLLARAEAAEDERDKAVTLLGLSKGFKSLHEEIGHWRCRAETAEQRCKELEARCKRLDESRENANEAAAKWEGAYKMALERAEKAEKDLDSLLADSEKAMFYPFGKKGE